MRRQLRVHRLFRNGEEQRRNEREDPDYEYDGWKQDDIAERRLIVEFIENAGWQFLPRLRVRDGVVPIMLRRRSGAALPCT